MSMSLLGAAVWPGLRECQGMGDAGAFGRSFRLVGGRRPRERE